LDLFEAETIPSFLDIAGQNSMPIENHTNLHSVFQRHWLLPDEVLQFFARQIYHEHNFGFVMGCTRSIPGGCNTILACLGSEVTDHFGIQKI
jgi:hypothetical protein